MLDDERIRNTLEATGLASPEDVHEFELLAMRRGISLFRAAIDSGLVPEDKLVAHVAGALGVASVSLRNFTAKPKLVAVLPPNIVKQHRALPVGLKERDGELVLFVAMDDPQDIDALEAIGQCCPHPVSPLLAGPVDLDQAIDRVYPRPEPAASGDQPTIPPVRDPGHDMFAHVLDDLERAQPSEMLSALSLLDDIPRNRHSHITPTTGISPIGPAGDHDPPPPAAMQRLSSGPFDGGVTDFGKPARGGDPSVSKAGFHRAGPASSSSLGLQARSGDELARALVKVLVDRGLVTEAELRAALEKLS